MRILKFLSLILICILCICPFSVHAEGNLPFGDVGDYGNWLTEDNIIKVNNNMSSEATEFQAGFEKSLSKTDYVPIEVRLGLSFMQALSSIDYVLQLSLVRYAIVILLIAYAGWIGFLAYKMMRESTNYKTVLYDIFKKGAIIAAWVVVLEVGPAKLFSFVINPIISLGIYLSDFILGTVAHTFNINIPDTCSAVHNYVANNASEKLLIDHETAANIMCLPARVSVYFYHATSAAWHWMINGFGHSAVNVAVGLYCVIMFIKCILIYAFMTLGIVTDLFLTLLMLPFTAIAESMPTTDEKNYAARVFNGFLGIFKTKKLSDVLLVFINAAIYFVSLSIIIAICAALLNNIIFFDDTASTSTGSMVTVILCGALVLYMANNTDTFIQQLGGKIDNTFGEKLKEATKKTIDNAKGLQASYSKAGQTNRLNKFHKIT